MCSAISLSSGVSFTVSDTEASPSDINANILLSPTLKTGLPHGQSSYVSGNDKLVGMLTDRDIAVRVVAEGKDPERVTVREVASKQVVTVDPQQDLEEALRIMAKHQVRRLPVVEQDGRLVGVVAQADVAREGDDKETGQLVQEISQ